MIILKMWNHVLMRHVDLAVTLPPSRAADMKVPEDSPITVSYMCFSHQWESPRWSSYCSLVEFRERVQFVVVSLPTCKFHGFWGFSTVFRVLKVVFIFWLWPRKVCNFTFANYSVWIIVNIPDLFCQRF